MASSNSWVDNNTHLPSNTARFDLRPLSTGEVLDRTFQLYRSRFALFSGLAVLPAAVAVVFQAAQLWYSAHQRHVHTGSSFGKVQIVTLSLFWCSFILSLVLQGITQAATTWAVSAVYLGELATIKEAYRTALKHWFRYTLIVLRQIWAAIWMVIVLFIPVIFVPMMWRGSAGANIIAGLLYIYAAVLFSIVFAIWAYIRVSLAVPAAVVESLKVGASIKRSKKLLVDRKLRIFLLLVFIFALYMVIVAIRMPLAYLLVQARGTFAFAANAIDLGVNFATRTLVGPLFAIAVCLFYIDERVRREGFDIEWMMTKIAPAPVMVQEPVPETATVTSPPSGGDSVNS
jgi:hypothetical protein